MERPCSRNRVIFAASAHARPAQLLPLRACVPQASSHTFDDQTALQLSHRAQHREDHLSSWGTGVHLLRIRNKIYAQRPECLTVSSARNRCETERANRSNRQTHTTSNRRLCASAISRFSSGRESFAPLTPASMYSPATFQRRTSANWCSSRVCMDTSCLWLTVDTRAYMATLVVMARYLRLEEGSL